MDTYSIRGDKYFLTYTDDLFFFLWVYIIKSKHVWKSPTIQFFCGNSNQLGDQVFNIDGRGEYISKDSQSFLLHSMESDQNKIIGLS